MTLAKVGEEVKELGETTSSFSEEGGSDFGSYSF